VQTFHEPPSLRPRCSSLSAVGHPRAGTKLHRAGNPRLGKVNGKTHSYRGRILSQESLTPTAHRPSFPTCLSHPRSIHLHCHPDSPSAAKPPLPWASATDRTGSLRALWQLQDPFQEFSLPPRTLSPGESRSQAWQPASSTATTSLTWRECYTQARQPVSFNSVSNTVGQPRGSTRTYTGQQATRSQALRGHNSPWEHRHGLPKTGDRQTLQHNKAQQLRDIRFSQPTIQDRLTALVSGMRDKQSTQRSNTDSTVLTEGVSAPQENNTGFGFQSCVRVCMQRSDGIHGFRQSMVEWRRNPKLS
jgi:hypothetical protein